MPKRTDIKSILLIGSGPIIIGQACEFDYSGTQALKALKEEGYRVILVNSNPATIMTDPDFADRTYIEPITIEIVEKIIQKERPDVLLPTLGGQTALNLAIELAERSILGRYGVEMIGAKLESIKKAEDRDLFKQAMRRAGLDLPRGGYARNLREAVQIQRRLNFPLIIRASRTLGGSGGNFTYGPEDFKEVVQAGLSISPVHEVLIEESVLGWKEFELEVMRDHKDNVVIICSIENFDAMGVHTGDSITVAPAQTLTDKEYQIMRDAALRVIREIGVDTGGSNIQFAVSPKDGRMVVIEMNPRVSRSSALASKATGFPIAKIAAKLAVGYTLDEIPNDITRETPACFEPTIDYVVVKVPRFTFEKFPQAKDLLTPQMKSVGEAMAIGRTFKEALQKAMRSLEINSYGFEEKIEISAADRENQLELLRGKLKNPNAQRLWYSGDAYRHGLSTEEIYQLSRIDPWFLEKIREIVESEKEIQSFNGKLQDIQPALLRQWKAMGFADQRLAKLLGCGEAGLRAWRLQKDIQAVFCSVDTCGAEFAAYTPYLYSTYEGQDESKPTPRKKIMILGGGPNRIGQGIEFDYCCVHAAFALKEAGYETIMVNCNPETVSTDYDTSDKLFFEPLTMEEVMNIIDREKPDGVIVQFGGQTPLKHALPLERAGVPINGTSPDSIERAGVHSGDSACSLPAKSIGEDIQDEIRGHTMALAKALDVRGLMNVQFAVQKSNVFVLEVNPRASRTVPFVSKAIGVPLAKIAAKVMTGKSLRELGFTQEIVPKHFSVKEAVFPFLRYEGVDISLGPEMKSTGEVMGIDVDLGLAYAKSQMAAPPALPTGGNVFVSVKDSDKQAVVPVVREFVKLGFGIIATAGTFEMLAAAQIPVTKVFKLREGRPNVLDRVKNGDINFIINTPSGKIPREDEVRIRNASLAQRIPIMTTVRAALASANGIRSLQKRKVSVRSLQEYHAEKL